MSVRSVAVPVVVLLFVTSGVAGGAPGAPPQPANDVEIEYDGTLIRVDLQEDGSATWTIQYRVELDDQNTTDAFDALQTDIRTNRSEFEGQFADRMNRTAGTAENTTGREMAIRNVSVETSRDEIQQDGIVSYTFTWTNFAVAEEDELRAGDAISGFVLDTGTTLLFTWPDTYGMVDATPDADEEDDGSVTWIGQEAFVKEEPRLVLERGAGTGTPSNDGLPEEETTTASPDKGGLLPILFGVGAAILVALAAAVWYLRRGGPGAATDASLEGDDESANGETATNGDGTGHGGVASAAGGDSEELLSNEERVLRLLEENGGRMKQQQVVQNLDWTDAKTSQVVGNLREDDEIDVFRIGRENVLAFPDETEF